MEPCHPPGAVPPGAHPLGMQQYAAHEIQFSDGGSPCAIGAASVTGSEGARALGLDSSVLAGVLITVCS